MSKWNELKRRAGDEALSERPSRHISVKEYQRAFELFLEEAQPAAILELIAENEQLKADKNTVDCRFEVSRDTLEVIRGCLRQAESEIDQMKAQAVERRGVSRALHEAVSAIYFNDSSDYESALWAVVRNLAPELIEELDSDPSAVWQKTEAMAKQESSK